ncbi:MAG: UDP-N-acetylglucosamine 2-epimerase (non-hydrolyzing) [Candidatus Azotimanducaceae bacterium]|jgi:UDP-N-acetylglucosamine 2-epimerase (non-hydrolysing)
MHERRSYLVIVGARPNFIKAAPLFRRALEYPDLDFTLVHTGQHFDDNMSKIFFEEMGIPKPDIHFDIKAEYHTEKIGKMFTALKEVVNDPKYTGVIVFGDVNSTLAGAIASSSHSKKLIHIESGLRSHDRRMPEEINRAVTDHLSDLLLVTELAGVDNLILEGIAPEKISLVGNMMIESIELFRETFTESKILEDLNLTRKEYVVATLHRVENTDEKKILHKLLVTLQEVAKKYVVVFPMHPATKNRIIDYGLDIYLEGLMIIDPVGYIDFMKLIIDAQGVVTDSGGIQEESSHLGVPCCTLRDNTERPVTVSHGSNKLFPINSLNSEEMINHLSRCDFVPASIPYWDSGVSKRILDLL